MIKALHTIIYSDDPEATRAFLHDILGWPFVQDSASIPPWPIFKSGPSEMAVHPTSGIYQGRDYNHPRHHSIALMCDDIQKTIAELKDRGAEFSGDLQDMGFGVAIMLRVPGMDDVVLYQPHHPEAYAL
jgi:predicted enzyme related to lactoylglutathione lyase